MKHITFSFVTIALLSNSAVAVDSLAEAFSNGKTSGQIRTFYIDRTYTGSIENNRNSLALGGNLGFETAAMSGVSIGAKFYTTNALGIHDGPRTASNYDPSLFGDGFESYSMVGEAYINYNEANTNVKVGRQKLDTPLAGSDDARMLPNLFEAAVISNTDLPDTTLIAAHVTREAVGSFANVYLLSSPANQQLALQSGYGLGYKLGTNGHFADMGAIALGGNTNTSGVTAGAVIYKGIEGATLQGWDYYAHDILNAVYLQGDYGWNCLLNDAVKMNASVQYINESDVGDKLAGKVDSQYAAAKLGATAGAVSGFVAYSTTGSNNDTVTHGGILTPWGGIPAFTQGMVTRHMFFADTDTTKVAGTYDFKAGTGADVKASAYYIAFNVGDEATYATGLNSKESGFEVEYNPANVKNLNLKLRANYPKDFGVVGTEPFSWSEYRLIANYNF